MFLSSVRQKSSSNSGRGLTTSHKSRHFGQESRITWTGKLKLLVLQIRPKTPNELQRNRKLHHKKIYVAFSSDRQRNLAENGRQLQKKAIISNSNVIVPLSPLCGPRAAFSTADSLLLFSGSPSYFNRLSGLRACKAQSSPSLGKCQQGIGRL